MKSTNAVFLPLSEGTAYNGHFPTHPSAFPASSGRDGVGAPSVRLRWKKPLARIGYLRPRVLAG